MTVQLDQSDAKSKQRRRLTSVLAADICNYSSLTERDEAAAIGLVSDFSKLLDDTINPLRGRCFHKAGDGFLVEFTSAADCLQAALNLLDSVKAGRVSMAGAPVEVRIGLHVGEVYEQEDGDLLGHGVNIAARLQSEAAENGILASGHFMNLVTSSFKGRSRRRGRLSLKNISEPIEAFDVEADASLLSRLARIARNFLRRNALVLGLFLLAMAAIVGVSLNTEAVNGKRDTTDLRVDTLIERGLEGRDGFGIDPVDSAYMRVVLRRLAESGKASDKVSFALLESGNIDGAIKALQESVTELSPDDPAYLERLHQIGALAIFHDTKQAAAIFETILLKDPADATAMYFLGSARQTLVSLDAGEALWYKALDGGRLNQDQTLQIRIGLAFNEALRGEFENGLQRLRDVEGEVVASEKPYLLESFHSTRGIMLEQADRLLEAEADLLRAIDLQKRFGYDYNTERAYNVLGFIAVKRADDTSGVERDRYLSEAERYFRLQYEAATKISKKRSEAEALYFLGNVELDRNEIDAAERYYLQAFPIVREGGYEVHDFLIRIGLAQIAQMRGDTTASCQHLDQANAIRDSGRIKHVGPKTQAKIDSLICA